MRAVEADGDAGALDDAAGSSTRCVSSPSSEPHATAVTATSASPAMATGIRVMPPSVPRVAHKIRTAPNLRGFHTVREGEA